MKKVLLEAATVAVVGAAVAFAANALSPRGLQLTRNYFPGAPRTTVPVRRAAPPQALQAGATNSPATNAAGAIELLSAQLKQEGLQLIDSQEAVRLFNDPARQQDLIVFIDARDDQHFQAGHIPGAYQFDHYDLTRFIPTVFPLCQRAQQVVIYCNGGDKCEDSKFAGIDLRDAGIAKEKLFVYGGGWTEWTNQHLPVETGPRQSGSSANAPR